MTPMVILNGRDCYLSQVNNVLRCYFQNESCLKLTVIVDILYGCDYCDGL